MHALSPAPLPAPAVSAAARSLDGGIALYVHIPFCETKCPYCDFNTYAGINHLLPAYLETLAREAAVWGETLGRPRVASVFLGGGTPSLLTPGQMETLLAAVRDAFDVAPDAEITAEVNPDDATAQRLGAFLRAGVNRLSVGVQSLDDAELRVLGRRHGAAQARAALAAARAAGCANLSADLMYGLPNQSMADWQGSVDGVIAAGVEHLSAYALTLEEGTPMHRQAERGALPEQDPDLAADMYWRADEALQRAGLRSYEISNWALPGRESRHNLTYWRNLPYLGIGPGAHSFLGGYRFANVDPPAAYMARVRAWQAAPEGVRALLSKRFGPVAEAAALDAATEMADTVILGLRLAEGVRADAFAARHGVALDDAFGAAISEAVEQGLLQRDGAGVDAALRLTARGRLLANEVFVRLVAPPGQR